MLSGAQLEYALSAQNGDSSEKCTHIVLFLSRSILESCWFIDIGFSEQEPSSVACKVLQHGSNKAGLWRNQQHARTQLGR